MSKNPQTHFLIFNHTYTSARKHMRALRNSIFAVEREALFQGTDRAFLAKIYSRANKQVGAEHRGLFAVRYEDPG